MMPHAPVQEEYVRAAGGAVQVASGRRMDVPEATLRFLASAASAHLEGLVQQAVRKHAVRANPSKSIPGMAIKSQVREVGRWRCW
jgi:hypothetical protein